MRRGYWSGFLMGGLIGMLAFRAYGSELNEWMQEKLKERDESQAPEQGAETAFGSGQPIRRA